MGLIFPFPWVSHFGPPEKLMDLPEVTQVGGDRACVDPMSPDSEATLVC